MRISDWSSDVCSSDLLRDVQTVRGWFGRILATTIVDHQRALARRPRREAAADSVDIEALPADPDAEIDATVCNCLYRLLPTLKAEYADVIWQADILGDPRDRLEIGRASGRERVWKCG